MNEEKWKGIYKLIEEMGELQQVLGKLLVTPDCQHWSGDLLPKLHEELGDVEAALIYFVKNNSENNRVLNIDVISTRYDNKLKLFANWKLSGIKS